MSSSEESVEEENNRDTDESIEKGEKGEEDNIGDCDTDEEEDGAVTVLKLSNGVMFRVPVKVQGMQLQAVVDTAAQVTLVSEEFYKSLDPVPPIRKEVVMNTAGKGMQMNGYIAGPFQVVLGTHLFTVEIYVVPIEEDMLLGLDFVEANGVFLHLKEKEQQIAGDVITMSLGTGSPLVNEETGVFLVKGCKVPPNSAVRVGAQLSESMASMAGECIVKAATKGEILIPIQNDVQHWRRKIGIQNCVDQHEGHEVGKYCKYITKMDFRAQCLFTVGETILVISLVDCFCTKCD